MAMENPSEVPQETGVVVVPNDMKASVQVNENNENGKTPAVTNGKKKKTVVVKKNIIGKKGTKETVPASSSADVAKIYEALVIETRKLGLTEESHDSRTTFKNGSRVCAFEKGQKQVTIHLPKSLAKADFTPLKRTFDKRKYGYVRVTGMSEVPAAVELVKWAREHNSE
jgi:hypothetical protein